MFIFLMAIVIVGSLILMACAVESNGSEESEHMEGEPMFGSALWGIIVRVAAFLLGCFLTALGAFFIVPVMTGEVTADALTWVFGSQGLFGLALLWMTVLPFCEWLGRKEKELRDEMADDAEESMIDASPIWPAGSTLKRAPNLEERLEKMDENWQKHMEYSAQTDRELFLLGKRIEGLNARLALRDLCDEEDKPEDKPEDKSDDSRFGNEDRPDQAWPDEPTDDDWDLN